MIYLLFYPYILHVKRELKSKRIQRTVFLKMMKFWNWSDLWNPILFLQDERCNEMSRLYKRSTKSRVSNRHYYSLFFFILVFMRISYLQLRYDYIIYTKRKAHREGYCKCDQKLTKPLQQCWTWTLWL